MSKLDSIESLTNRFAYAGSLSKQMTKVSAVQVFKLFVVHY